MVRVYVCDYCVEFFWRIPKEGTREEGSTIEERESCEESNEETCGMIFPSLYTQFEPRLTSVPFLIGVVELEEDEDEEPNGEGKLNKLLDRTGGLLRRKRVGTALDLVHAMSTRVRLSI